MTISAVSYLIGYKMRCSYGNMMISGQKGHSKFANRNLIKPLIYQTLLSQRKGVE